MFKEEEMMKNLDELLERKIGRTEESPTLDVVPVIRCKDCEECDIDDLKKGRSTVFCFKHAEYMPLKYFCASGRRREK